MSLVIEAFSNIIKLNPKYNLDDVDREEPFDPYTNKYYENTFKASVDPEFKLQAQEINNGDVFSYTNRKIFIDTSCTHYNSWRYDLSSYLKIIFRSFSDNERPFKELIHFSDCEGTICSSVSQKLYNDFCSFDSIAQSKRENHFYDYFYLNLKECFKMASNNGAVIFY